MSGKSGSKRVKVCDLRSRKSARDWLRMGDGRWEIGDGRWEMGDGRCVYASAASLNYEDSCSRSQFYSVSLAFSLSLSSSFLFVSVCGVSVVAVQSGRVRWRSEGRAKKGGASQISGEVFRRRVAVIGSRDVWPRLPESCAVRRQCERLSQ